MANTTTTTYHIPSRVTILWLLVSLPLVAWDSGYVLMRPHTMEGGALHYPLWAPYKLYGEVDHVYGWKAFHAHSGFTSAQGFLNVIESALYVAYLRLAFSRRTHTVVTASGASEKALVGRDGAAAVLLGFAASVMTLSKTLLYWLNEYFSGFDNIGHNRLSDLIPLWIIPNGLWLVFPAYMTWAFARNIYAGLTLGPAHAKTA